MRSPAAPSWGSGHEARGQGSGFVRSALLLALMLASPLGASGERIWGHGSGPQPGRRLLPLAVGPSRRQPPLRLLAVLRAQSECLDATRGSPTSLTHILIVVLLAMVGFRPCSPCLQLCVAKRPLWRAHCGEQDSSAIQVSC